MTTDSNRQTGTPSPTPHRGELKASDFFPPGAGWNQAQKPADADERKDTSKQPGNVDKH